jgi:HlyD family secretion protein
MTKRRIWTIVVAVALLAAGVAAWRLGSGSSKPKFQFDTAKVEKGKIVAKVTATGTLSAIVTVQVGSQVSGRIAALYADFNSPVKKGQLVAKIDPALFQAAVDQAKANYLAAQGNLAKAQAQALDAGRQYKRQKELAARQLNAQADVDTAQANADAANASVKAAEGTVAQTKAALNSAEVNLAYTNIISPTNGTVISRSVDVGQTVAASFQAPTIFVIAEDLEKMQVDTSVAEADVGRLKAGMAASFTVDAYPSEVFRGVVRQVRNNPQTVQNVVTYDAVIDVSNPELKLKPGMTANVTFVYAEKDDVLKVPNAALRFKPPPPLLAELGRGGGASGGATGATGPTGSTGPAQPSGGGGRGGGAGGRGAEAPDRRTVWTYQDEKPAPVRIRTGISDGSWTEVVEGNLTPGEVVITDVLGSGRDLSNLRRGL